jgi:DNA invertase Pin-like site-specific DNA recombinase
MTGPQGEYLYRRLTPQQEQAVAVAHEAGVPPDAIAREYRVSRRTVYRTLARAPRPHRVVECDGWKATFVLTDEGPVRVTAWYPA